MRITAAQRAETENRIRAAMDRLLRGELPPGGNCDIKTLAREADVDRTAFYGQRPYAHLREEFEQRLERLRQSGESPDPRTAQINRLKNEVTALKARVARADRTIEELADFRAQALSRLAAQREEIIRLRSALNSSGNVISLSTRLTNAPR
jgi:chromosome segregation ATPase